jgi:NADPH:quinone reductase-like Zn-dependent oxidoreductase
MKAIIIRETGGTEKLLYEEVETPTPGPGEVVVRIRAAGVNHLDHDIREGLAGFPTPVPHVPGIEGAGEVAEIGAGVTSVKIGDRVSISIIASCGVCRLCRTGRENLCDNPNGLLGIAMWGTYAEYTCVKENQLVAMPEALDFKTAAAGHLCFATAWHMAVTLGKIHAGQDVLVNAAGSGVGSSAIQIAKLHGANVIASAGSDEKLVRAKELGADEVINYNTQDLAEEAIRLSGGKGPDLVLESVGGVVLQKSLQAVAKAGCVVTCGCHAGESIELDVVSLFRKHVHFQGSALASLHETAQVLDLLASGKLKPVIHAALPLAKASDAAALIANRKFFGKMILLPE